MKILVLGYVVLPVVSVVVQFVMENAQPHVKVHAKELVRQIADGFVAAAMVLVLAVVCRHAMARVQVVAHTDVDTVVVILCTPIK